jgi:guanylate kinase
MTPRGNLFIISAPSGAGKTTLVEALVEKMAHISVAISHTTRPPRCAETDGINYHFVDQATFLALQEADAFLETAEVFGNLYGTSVGAVEQALAQGEDIILEIDWQGARQVRKKFPQAVTVFILPPSRASLQKRLDQRSQDPPSVIRQRMSQAIAEMSHFSEYDYLVINDDFDLALQELCTLVLAGRLDCHRQQVLHREMLAELLP